MTVWWCTKHQRAGLVATFCCSFGQMVEMELHPAGTRTVGADAQKIIAREIAGFHLTMEDAFNTAAIIVNALAQSKDDE